MATTTFTAYIPLRAVSGLYTTGLSVAPVRKNWKPHALTPLVDDKGRISPEWNRFLGDLAGRKLGGAIYPTLPDVAQFVTQTQVDAQLSAAQDQWAASNAQVLQALIEVVKANGLTGAGQVPSAVLARQETNPQPVSALPESPGGGD